MDFSKQNSLFYPIIKCFIIGLIATLPNKLFAQRGFYTPKALVIPLHDEARQLFMSVGWGGGLDLNLSYALTNKFAVFGSSTVNMGSRPGVTILGSSYTINKNDYVLKGGLGYFTKIDTRFFKIFEASFGAAISKVDNSWYFNNYREGIEYTYAKYNSLFGQINVGRKKTKTEYAVGVRLNYSKYGQFNSFEPNASSAISEYQNVKGLSMDPVVSFSYNLGKVKLNSQIGLAVPLGGPSVNVIDTYISYDQQTSTTNQVAHTEKMYLGNVLGRLSIQYRLGFGKK